MTLGELGHLLPRRMRAYGGGSARGPDGSPLQNDTARCVWQCDLECRCQRTGQRTGDL